MEQPNNNTSGNLGDSQGSNPLQLPQSPNSLASGHSQSNQSLDQNQDMVHSSVNEDENQSDEEDENHQNDNQSLMSDDDEEIEDEEGEPAAPAHQIRSILEVKFEPGSIAKIISGDNSSSEENRFLVDWSCECCQSVEKQQWLSMKELIEQYGIPAVNIHIIEEQARKQIREQETRKQAQQLMKYLNFNDIDDFEDAGKTQSFVEYDYYLSDDTESRIDSDDEDSDDLDSQNLRSSPKSTCLIECTQMKDKFDDHTEDNCHENPESMSPYMQMHKNTNECRLISSHAGLDEKEECKKPSISGSTRQSHHVMESQYEIISQHSPICCSSQNHQDCIASFRSKIGSSIQNRRDKKYQDKQAECLTRQIKSQCEEERKGQQNKLQIQFKRKPTQPEHMIGEKRMLKDCLSKITGGLTTTQSQTDPLSSQKDHEESS